MITNNKLKQNHKPFTWRRNSEQDATNL